MIAPKSVGRVLHREVRVGFPRDGGLGLGKDSYVRSAGTLNGPLVKVNSSRQMAARGDIFYPLNVAFELSSTE